ncbi:hypothetical protein RC52_25885 [Herbaspirillum rubrisubalbicans]|nr:hypothetical protein [Herbaspirillum rubrisubalbicans]
MTEVHASTAPLSVADQATLCKVAAELVALAAFDIIEKMRPSNIQAERIRASLYLNIIESLSACNTLVRAKMETHAALHIRAMLESLVNMTLLHDKSDHINQMSHDKLDGEFKICTELLEDPYLSDGSREKLRSWIARIEPARKELRDAKYRKKVVSKLIIEAQLPFLALPYLTLNSMAHWDLAVLSERHESPSGGLRVFAETSPEVIVALLSEAVKIAIMATSAVRAVALFADGVYEEAFERMNKAWKTVLDQFEKNAS